MTISFNRREALLLAGTALAATALRAAPKISAFKPLESQCLQLIADKYTPGMSLCVMRNGAPIYSNGFGYANLESSQRVTSQSIFRIGSITKQFTAAAILLLAQEGKLSLDDKLSRFLPLFPHADDFTLKQMLTHTSGLGNYTHTPTFMQSSRVDYNDPQLIAAMAETDPLMTSEPGTAWSYSNTAYVLLGLVVGIVAQQRYGAFFRQRLFDPAGLQLTAVDDASEVVQNRATGYTPDGQSASGFKNASFISMTYPGAAGSMRSTSEDLCRWHTALLGGRVVSAESLKAMLTPVRLKDGSLPLNKDAQTPEDKKKPVEYGFGVATGDFEGHRYVEHGGGINGFISHLRSFPAEKISVAMIFNCDMSSKTDSPKRLEALRDTAARAALASA